MDCKLKTCTNKGCTNKHNSKFKQCDYCRATMREYLAAKRNTAKNKIRSVCYKYPGNPLAKEILDLLNNLKKI